MLLLFFLCNQNKKLNLVETIKENISYIDPNHDPCEKSLEKIENYDKCIDFLSKNIKELKLNELTNNNKRR